MREFNRGGFKPQEGKPVYCKDCYAKRKKF